MKMASRGWINGKNPQGNYLPMANAAIGTKKNPVKDEGLYVEPVIAWRCWGVDSEDLPFLRSWTKQVIWKPGEKLEAKCIGPPIYSSCKEPQHPAPNTHGCGIYGVNTLEQAMEWAAQSGKGVVGVVKLWGRVIVCEQGYLAQFAYPAAVIGRLRDLPKSIVEIIADKYGVPTEWAV